MKYVYRKPHVRALMGLYDAFGWVFMRRRPPKISGPPQRITFLVLHQIGDAIMCLPAIAAIRRACPDAECDLVVGSVNVDLLRPSAGDMAIHAFDAGWDSTVRHTFGGASGTETLLGSMIVDKLQPDVAFAFHPDLHVNRVMGTARVPHSYAFADAGGGFWVAHPSWVPQAGHQVERAFELARRFGRDFEMDVGEPAAPRLEVDPEAARRVEQITADWGPFAALHPFARFNSRSWSAERWNELIAWLRARELRPVLIGGPKDDASLYSGAESLCGKLTLPESAALLRQAALFVGIDSGPGHIAAAVETPVVSIFSAANVPERWSPYPKGNRVEVLYHDVVDRKRFPLQVRDLPVGTEGNPYTDGITTGEAIAACQRLLGAKAN